MTPGGHKVLTHVTQIQKLFPDLPFSAYSEENAETKHKVSKYVIRSHCVNFSASKQNQTLMRYLLIDSSPDIVQSVYKPKKQKNRKKTKKRNEYSIRQKSLLVNPKNDYTLENSSEESDIDLI